MYKIVNHGFRFLKNFLTEIIFTLPMDIAKTYKLSWKVSLIFNEYQIKVHIFYINYVLLFKDKLSYQTFYL